MSFNIAFEQPGQFIYAREGHPHCQEAEQKLSAMEAANAVLYGSGLSAVWAVLMHRQPKTITYSCGYHGTIQSLEMFSKLTGATFSVYNGQSSDLLLIESPRNPSGEMFQQEIQQGQIVAVDVTMAPAPLQNAFELYNATYVITSLTKFHSGHGDVLAGMMSVKSTIVAEELINQRSITGTILHGFDCWLLLRSLETYQLRLFKQSASAEQLKKVFNESPLVTKVQNEIGAVLNVEFKDEEIVHQLIQQKPFLIKTSFGSTVTTMESRAQYGGSKLQIRFSVGVEDFQILQEKLLQTALFTSKNLVKYHI